MPRESAVVSHGAATKKLCRRLAYHRDWSLIQNKRCPKGPYRLGKVHEYHLQTVSSFGTDCMLLEKQSPCVSATT